MSTIIICIVIAVAFAAFKSKDFWTSVLGGIVGFAIGFCLYFLGGSFLGTKLPTVEVIEEQEIYALSDSSATKGASYLFAGYIDEKLVYGYVVDTERGKQIKEIDAKNAYITEGDYTPTIRTHKIKFKHDWYNWFARDEFIEEDYVEFLVPIDTITAEYNVDLQ